jgi:hypothetical protein
LVWLIVLAPEALRREPFAGQARVRGKVMDPRKDLKPMERRQLIEALDRHAEALKSGADLAAPLLDALPAPDRPALVSLLQTARRVQAVLVYREPRPAFVRQLKAELLAAPRLTRAAAPRRLPDRRTLLWWAAGAGGVLSAAGVGFLAYRAVSGRISGIMAQRAARPALPEAQAAP